MTGNKRYTRVDYDNSTPPFENGVQYPNASAQDLWNHYPGDILDQNLVTVALQYEAGDITRRNNPFKDKPYTQSNSMSKLIETAVRRKVLDDLDEGETLSKEQLNQAAAKFTQQRPGPFLRWRNRFPAWPTYAIVPPSFIAPGEPGFISGQDKKRATKGLSAIPQQATSDTPTVASNAAPTAPQPQSVRARVQRRQTRVTTNKTALTSRPITGTTFATRSAAAKTAQPAAPTPRSSSKNATNKGKGKAKEGGSLRDALDIEGAGIDEVRSGSNAEEYAETDIDDSRSVEGKLVKEESVEKEPFDYVQLCLVIPEKPSSCPHWVREVIAQLVPDAKISAVKDGKSWVLQLQKASGAGAMQVLPRKFQHADVLELVKKLPAWREQLRNMYRSVSFGHSKVYGPVSASEICEEFQTQMRRMEQKIEVLKKLPIDPNPVAADNMSTYWLVAFEVTKNSIALEKELDTKFARLVATGIDVSRCDVYQERVWRAKEMKQYRARVDAYLAQLSKMGTKERRGRDGHKK